MTDILIRMEMPKTCSQCPAFNCDYMLCNILSIYHHDYYDSRIDGCPLVELPEHGDLISLDDAKTVITRFLGYIDDDLVFRMKFMLGKDCPVIVPPNKEETE